MCESSRTSPRRARGPVAPRSWPGGTTPERWGPAGRPRRPCVVLVTTDLDDADVWQHALAVGAEQVVVLPDAQEWLVERIARTVEPASAGRVIAVVGAAGGAGASTFAAALAATGADL